MHVLMLIKKYKYALIILFIQKMYININILLNYVNILLT